MNNSKNRLNNLDAWEQLKQIKLSCLSHSNIANPIYTIAIPTYKRTDLLLKALDSALQQGNGIRYEILVVDNNPQRNDETEIAMKQVKSNRITYVKNQQNVGMRANWNRCVQLAHGQWVIMCHDDDMLLPHALANIESMRRIEPNAKAIWPKFFELRGNGNCQKALSEINIKELSLWRKIWTTSLPLAANLFCDNIYGPPTCGLAVHKMTVEEFGGWSDECKYAMDWWFGIWFSEHYSTVKNNFYTGIYRWDSNETLKTEVMDGFTDDRNIIFDALQEYDHKCSTLLSFFKRDFEKRRRSRITEDPGYSWLFRRLRHYYERRIR